MKVSEIAKELGYKAADLVKAAKEKGIEIKGVRAVLDSRTVSALRSALPHASGGSPKKMVKTAVEKTPKEKVKRVVRKAVPEKEVKKREAPAPVAKAEEPKPLPPPPPKPVTPVAVTPVAKEVPPAPPGISPSSAPSPVRPSEAKPSPPSPVFVAEKMETVPEAPVIDVDKIVGSEKEVRVLNPHQIDVYSKETDQDKKRFKPVAAKPTAPTAVIDPYRGRPKPKRPFEAPSRETATMVVPADRTIEVTVPVSIKDFSQLVGIKAHLILKKLIEKSVMANINTMISEDAVGLLALELNRKVEIKKAKSLEDDLTRNTEKDKPEDLVPRPPVVVFMGHVDHGKTSLLDRIRKTNIVSKESGGITQHIGACKIKTAQDKSVVFLDTPGHEAFTAMRARGANVTDVAVLVVAADDGVMPQTEEAINHARAATVPIVVAINKCDKKEANTNRVKQQLSHLGLIPEEWGGNTVCVEVSAIAGKNIDLLVEMLSLEAELRELKANPRKKASGTVLEAKKSETRGVLATVLVQDGTLRRGDVILCGTSYGKVRAMVDDLGKTLHEAPPATPVELTGLNQVPEAGDRFQVVDDITTAKAIAEDRTKRVREAALSARTHITLDNLFSHIESGGVKEVRIILKVDVKGSLEVLRDALQNLSNKEVKIRLIHSGTGGINESDIILADASDAIILGFHVIPDERARALAKEKGVDIRMYQVIYQIIEDMKAALEGMLEPEKVEVTLGHCSIKEVFKISKVGTVAGCMVTDGKLERTAHVRLIRENTVIYDGKLESLKRFKEDVREVQQGYECGLKIAGYDDIKTGDVVQAYQIQEVARKLTK